MEPLDSLANKWELDEHQAQNLQDALAYAANIIGENLKQEEQKRQELIDLENSSMAELLTHDDPRIRAAAKACAKEFTVYA